jgi:hypothetical protein
VRSPHGDGRARRLAHRREMSAPYGRPDRLLPQNGSCYTPAALSGCP